ncbi:MAG: helix-turn-helix transcriptional regulator [Thermoleophilia bacterium]|nr:helix-turn-helix transcriptional regulator [Thermoleophilia bacterium]
MKLEPQKGGAVPNPYDKLKDRNPSDAALAPPLPAKPKLPLLKPLVDARKKAGITQVEIARSMRTSQENVSRLERANDMKVSTLEKYAFAVLGDLKIEAKIQGRSILLLHHIVAVEDGGPGQG